MSNFLAICLVVLAATTAAAQANQSFIIDTEDLSHPLMFKEFNRSGPHKVTLSRIFANDNEEKLVRIAESVYPAAREVSQNSVSNVERASSKERQWWCSSFDGVRIPYAITRNAVVYYLKVSEEFGKKKPENAFWTNMISSNLSYSAKVSRKEKYEVGTSQFTDIVIVSMRLEWLQYCGNLCAMAFKATRNVVLKDDGTVLAIENDTCAPAVVS